MYKFYLDNITIKIIFIEKSLDDLEDYIEIDEDNLSLKYFSESLEERKAATVVTETEILVFFVIEDKIPELETVFHEMYHAFTGFMSVVDNKSLILKNMDTMNPNDFNSETRARYFSKFCVEFLKSFRKFFD